MVNMAALANEEFKVAEEIMAKSVVQGGPAPGFLSSSSFSYIVHGVSSINADDANDIVEDVCLKEAIEKIFCSSMIAKVHEQHHSISVGPPMIQSSHFEKQKTFSLFFT